MLNLSFDQGLNTAKDPSALAEGELSVATGGYYRPGDMRLHKIGGTIEFGDTGTGERVDGVALCQFDSGLDRLVALSGESLFSAALTATGDTGTFATLSADLGSMATSLSAAHYNDRWYLAVGSQNVVLKSDGTVRRMGMRAPAVAPTATPGTTSFVIRPNSSSGDFTNPSFAFDTDINTYAHAQLNAAGTKVQTYRFGTSNTGTSRVLTVVWEVSGTPFTNSPFSSEGNFDDVGGGFDSGFFARAQLRFSEDNGVTWTEFLRVGMRTHRSISVAQTPISNTFEISGNLVCEASLVYTFGDTSASLRIRDILVSNGGSASNFSTSTGLYYAVAEYDEDENLISKANPSKLVTLVTQNHVVLTLPSAAVNTNATHWRIYRTTDGGTIPADLGLIGTVPITATTFVDDFVRFDKDTPARPFYRLLRTLDQQDAQALSPLFFDLDSPPPRLARIRAHEGSLIGLSADNTRALYYSISGVPESWPEINVITSFPLEEHDELLDCVSLGAILLIGARGAMLRLSGLPRVVNSVRDASRVEWLRGAPGCVGRYAMAPFSVAGESMCAWISHHGVYVTNGDQISRISDDLDWDDFEGLEKSGWVLHWDAQRLALVMAVGAGENSTYYLFHMSIEHRKERGQPKITGPHYGRINHLASGHVGNAYRLYSAGRDGAVYTLEYGATDASQSYSGTTVPLIVTTGQVYAEQRNWSALDARLYHTDFGDGQTCQFTWEAGNDDEEGGSAVMAQTVSLSGQKGTQLDLSQRCQWARLTLTHTGAAGGALRDLVVETVARGRSGSARVA